MRILIVEDDEYLADLVQKNLKLEGYDTTVCYDGLSALSMCSSAEFDMVVLDIMLPGMDGFHVCKELQYKNIPIIMITAKNDITDKLAGLEAGADDYIVKPFDSRELTARIKAVMRRLERGTPDKIVHEEPCIKAGFSINEITRRALLNGHEVELTPIEFDMLLLFSKNPDRVFTREQLIDEVWGYEFLGDSRTVDMHIQRIRKKMGADSGCLETVFGVGYRFKELNRE